MATYGSIGTREVRASRAYTCEACGGIIDRKEMYFNFHSELIPGNWQGRRHFDCGPAWWQGDPTHLLSALAALPGGSLPEESVQPILTAIPVSIRSIGEAGEVRHDLSPKYALQLLHTPKVELRVEAFSQIGRAQALFADVLMAARGDPKIAQQVSHLLQQLAQVAKVNPYRP